MNEKLYQKQLEAFNKKQHHLKPLSSYIESSSITNTNEAQNAIAQGKLGCIILAGGEGSRMHSDLPKALLPILENKTLLQLFCEKNQGHPLAIMTSDVTHDAIAKQLSGEAELFKQSSLPLLDENKHWFYQQNSLVLGPNGNGKVLHDFYQSGLWKKWNDQGVTHINIVPIDNPLADPQDPLFLQSHLNAQAEISVKAVFRLNPQESVGLIGTEDNKPCVIEYSEVSPEERTSLTLANTGFFCFSMDFIAQNQQIELPLHIAEKMTTIEGKPKKIYKCETFLFDLLPYSSKTNVVLCPRERTFAPIKDQKSFICAQKALLKKS